MTIPDFTLPGPTHRSRSARPRTATTRSRWRSRRTAPSPGRSRPARRRHERSANPLALGTLLADSRSRPNPLTPHGDRDLDDVPRPAARPAGSRRLGEGPLGQPVPDRSLLSGRGQCRSGRPGLQQLAHPARALVTIGSTGGDGDADDHRSARPNTNATYFGGPVALSIEGGPGTADPGRPVGDRSRPRSAPRLHPQQELAASRSRSRSTRGRWARRVPA